MCFDPMVLMRRKIRIESIELEIYLFCYTVRQDSLTSTYIIAVMGVDEKII